MSYLGQSFTPGPTGTFNNITFSFQAPDGTDLASGDLYLFTSAYIGTPSGLATAANVYGIGIGNGSTYVFSPSLTLSSGTEYYAYADSPQTESVGLSVSNPYHNGMSFATANSGSSYVSGGTTIDTRFIVQSGAVVSSVPEPATWVMMTLGVGAMGFTMRRRQKSQTRVLCAS